MKTRALAIGISSLALALTAAGCAKDDTSTTTESGLKLVKSGTLTICTHLPYEPFEFTEGGEVVGFDPDVLKIAADAEGLDTEVIDVAWETITTGEALNTDQCDVAAGAMTITDERAAVMDFTDPYFTATQALMTKTGSGISSLEDLAGKKVAVQDGTTGADYVRENAPKDTEIVSYEDSSLMQQAVLTGKTDAGVNDNGLLNYFVSQNPEVEVVTEFETGEEYGFSVKKDGNDDLLTAINDGIASDDYDTVYEKWFGTAPAE
ncbi:ABC transporter substrate-binding protein [Nocardioides sp. Root122]|uniref:transporter substrate-binding domain-containing protein n=1 Tax=Nocardioides TaxID=1839 RepID=UPI00070258DA|nr:MULTISPECIES: transporter substrate-binding domain-containing protein [Nocardioides]KQV65790.1 ABC transporter substrate-binding protein [Nocardioides sp. Root122]MCK9823297.1 transporter substrate-binding domain-containing protein [Nocardioides cavernae]